MLLQTVPSMRVTQIQRAMALLFICSVPFWFSAPTLLDSYGQTEEGVNNAIWALGARNIIRNGLWRAKLGAVVTPFPGAGGGIYAHHPPLPIWASGLLQLVTDREYAPRVLALVLVGVSLALLFSILRQYVSEETSLLSVALVTLSTFVLTYSRMLTTLTMATPLFILLLRSVLRRARGESSWGIGTLLNIAALVFSSWDGVIGAATLVTALSAIELRDAYRNHLPFGRWLRTLSPAVTFLLMLCLVFAYLINANGSAWELLGVALWRGGVSEFPLRMLIRREIVYTGNGVGWATVALMAAAAVWGWQTPRGRQLLVATVLAAAPGLGMVMLFRNGALNHEFWGYNLFIPAAFGLAIVIERFKTNLPKPATICLLFVLGVQGLLAMRASASQLEREHQLNALGTFLVRNFRNQRTDRVRLFWGYDFHPYIAWYLKLPHEVAYSGDDVRQKIALGQWKAEDLVVTDNHIARYLDCKEFSSRFESQNGYWSITTASELEKSCPRS